MTLNRVLDIILHYFTEFGSFWSQLCQKWLELDPYCLWQKCSPKNLVFGNIRFMVIFSEITDEECIIKESYLPPLSSFPLGWLLAQKLVWLPTVSTEAQLQRHRPVRIIPSVCLLSVDGWCATLPCEQGRHVVWLRSLYCLFIVSSAAVSFTGYQAYMPYIWFPPAKPARS